MAGCDGPLVIRRCTCAHCHKAIVPLVLNVEPLLPPGGGEPAPREPLRLPAAIDQDHSRARGGRVVR